MRQVIAAICNKHGFHHGENCTLCMTQSNSAFYTARDKLWEFVDINTTGRPIQFSSKRQWEKHLRERGMYQLSKTDLKKMQREPVKVLPKTDYKKVAIEAWKDRTKFVQDYKYGRIKPHVYAEH